MKVKIQVCMAGSDYVWKPGDVVTIDDKAEVERLIAAGFAVPVVAAPEKAVAPEVEKRGKSK